MATKVTSYEQRVVDAIKERMAADFDYAYEVLTRFHLGFAAGMYDNVDAMNDFADRWLRYRSGQVKMSDKQRAYITKIVTRFAKQYFCMMQRARTEPESLAASFYVFSPESIAFLQADSERTFSGMLASEDEKVAHAACKTLAVSTLRKL